MIKSILFNDDMVRAILKGKKTVTRRLGRWKIRKFNIDKHGIVTATMVRETKSGKVARHFASGTIQEFINVFSDYQPGDTLYCRETWGTYTRNWWEADYFMYRADYSDNATTYEVEGHVCDLPKWRPSIHMPKEVARIWLMVTDVRVERLQDITVEECKKEGIWDDYQTLSEEYHDMLMEKAYPETFGKLWNSTIKKSDLDRYGWDANPWVWVIEFVQCMELEGA